MSKHSCVVSILGTCMIVTSLYFSCVAIVTGAEAMLACNKFAQSVSPSLNLILSNTLFQEDATKPRVKPKKTQTFSDMCCLSHEEVG